MAVVGLENDVGVHDGLNRSPCPSCRYACEGDDADGYGHTDGCCVLLVDSHVIDSCWYCRYDVLCLCCCLCSLSWLKLS